MKFRIILCVLSLALCITTGCSKKTDQTSESTQPATSETGSAASGGTATTGEAARRAAGKTESAKPVAAKPVVIPAGTVVTVRLGESLSSKTAQAGQTFTATVARPVEVDGKTVIADGASATGTVVNAKAAGKFKGASVLALKLDSITIDGRSRPVETSLFSEAQKGKGKRTAVAVGGGAGLGALIGGLAGGGKGAAIGALAGAGAGTAGAAYTGNNRDVSLPAESAVSFKLENPVTISQ